MCAVAVGLRVRTGVVFSKLSDRVDLFRSRAPPAEGGKACSNAAPVLRLLSTSKDPYTVTKAAKISATLLSFDPVDTEAASTFVFWVRNVLRSRDAYDAAASGGTRAVLLLR
jgi:hypothetical protein